MRQPASSHSKQSLEFSVTHRSVLAIAVPMTLAYLTTPLLGLVDLTVIGRLGDAALLGGIALGSVIFDLVFASFNFLRSGTTGLTAQALGAQNQIEIRAALLRALVVATLVGGAILLLQRPILNSGLWFLGGSADVQDATARYFDVRIYSAPFLLANYAILGWLIGLGRAGVGLVLQLSLNGLNILLSLWFVLGLNWSVEGVALATVTAEICASFVGLGLVLSLTRKGRWPDLARVFDRTLLLRTMAVNRDIMIRSFALIIAFAFFMARSADQGDVILAANALLEKLLIFAAFFLDGLATAAEQLAGRAVGARHRPAFDRTLKLTALWSLGLAGILSALFWILGPILIDFMTTSEPVRATAMIYLFWAILTPLFGVLAFQMDGVFIGATWSSTMRNMMLLSLLVYLTSFYVLFPLFGNHGLWIAFLLFFGVRGVTLLIACKKRAQETFAQS